MLTSSMSSFLLETKLSHDFDHKVSRRHEPQQTRPGCSRLYVPRESTHHADVVEMWRYEHLSTSPLNVFPDPQQLLGVGLNLTRANNVISLDLGWSMAVEAQAYDRVHRLGQTRDVAVQRLVIADTVEDRILERQERKVSHQMIYGDSNEFADGVTISSNCLLTAVWAKALARS